ncbi:MAG: MerR family transcriptional regulator [Chloroflexi bacterium]|nr:MerR family transcriptional regulator [Chloroflexota bacterium]
MAGLTIKIVAERTGVSVHTLRAWERRYGVPRPSRHADNRYRLYDEHDIANVLWMKRQIASGLSPAQASLLFQQKSPAQAFAATQPPLAEMQAALLAAFVEADENAAQKILDQAFALFAPAQVALDIIQPTMASIGEQWAQNEIAVWQEHLASNLVRRKLAAVLQSQASNLTLNPRVLTACAPAEDHEIGLLMFAWLAQQQGWSVTYLGQRTPLAEIAAAARQARSNWVVVTVTTVIGLASLLPWLRQENRPPTPLAFGGRLLNLVPALQERLPGVFLGDDLSTAARSLATLKPCREVYAPRRRAWDAVMALQEHRLTIAGESAEAVFAQLSLAPRARWRAEDLRMAGLYLTDSLASALAFDVPDLMELDGRWLKQMLSPRAVPPDAVVNHIKLFSRALSRALGSEHASAFKPLLARLSDACFQ